MNYDLYLHSTYIGTYTAKGVADKLDVTPGYVMKATREHKKIKNKWTTIRSDRELTDTRRKIITRQRKQKIVGSAAVKRTTSAGRTDCLPKWKEF